MPSGGMKEIRLRMKSISGNMQITNAMQLVASSKLRKAKERMLVSTPFFDTLFETMNEIELNNTDFSSSYFTKNHSGNALYIVIAGDRGLAGGYNNIIINGRH